MGDNVNPGYPSHSAQVKMILEVEVITLQEDITVTFPDCALSKHTTVCDLPLQFIKHSK